MERHRNQAGWNMGPRSILSLPCSPASTPHHLQGQADRYTDKIVDFSRCPSCNSTDISEIQGEEAKQSGQSNTVTTSAASSAEEIKKFSELLEMGIITQEEFDAKKKQLLGL